MRIAFFSTQSYDKEYFDKLNKQKQHSITYYDDGLNKYTVALTKDFDAVCVFVNDALDKETIAGISNNGIKLIALRCAGFNNIDLKAAAENNIKVLRVPAYSPQAVAEHTIALILTLNRKTHKAYNRVRDGNFLLENLMGFNLAGKTVGVIGTGRIGSQFCKIMLGFGCKVIASDIIESEELKKKGVVYKSNEELFSESDIISLHCPLIPSTKHLINKETIEKMKTGVMLINTSRGAVINTPDVTHAMESGKIGYLGIDVYEQEEGMFFHDLSESISRDEVIIRLIAFPNVLVTAHQGFFTKEAMEEITKTTLQNFTDFEERLTLENEVKL